LVSPVAVSQSTSGVFLEPAADPTDTPVISATGGGALGFSEVEPIPYLSRATVGRHVMCKGRDSNWDPVYPTTIFKNNDEKVILLMTVVVNSKVESRWFYRSDSSKSWVYYTSVTSYVSGSYYIAHGIGINGYLPGNNFPRGWKVDVFLDYEYKFSEFFEITDGGLEQCVTCSDVVNAQPVGVKSVFKIGVDDKVALYVKITHAAYFNAATNHCNDAKVVWYSPNGNIYKQLNIYWRDYKDIDETSDYWGFIYTS